MVQALGLVHSKLVQEQALGNKQVLELALGSKLVLELVLGNILVPELGATYRCWFWLWATYWCWLWAANWCWFAAGRFVPLTALAEKSRFGVTRNDDKTQGNK